MVLMIQSKHNNKENLLFYSFLGMLAVISSYVTKDINMIIRPLVFMKKFQAQGKNNSMGHGETNMHF